MTIINLQRRLHEAGRIRIGDTVPSGRGRRPVKLTTFRFTSRNQRSIEAVARTYGGTVKAWENAPGGDQWEVVTEASEIPVVVPPEQMSFSQHYELWSGGGCNRRCDGEHESISQGPCICDPDDRECKPHTRLSLMLAAYPGTGLWRIDTSGYYAAVELGGAMEVAAMLTATVGRAVLPGMLRVEARTVKRPDKPPNNFTVPVLDFQVDMAALATGTAAAIAGTTQQVGAAAAALPMSAPTGPVTPVPALAAVPDLPTQLQAVEEPEPRTKRAGSAPTPPPTGRARRTAAEAAADAPRAIEAGATPAPAPAKAAARKAPAKKVAAPTTAPTGDVPGWCRDLHMRAQSMDIDDLGLDAIVLFVTNGRTSSSKELQAREAGQVNETMTEIAKGELALVPQVAHDGTLHGYSVAPKF